ncbi:BspA family leucine-rich repeat surface protein [Enterococcus faecalis]|uniref:BspA family leucine-rich repeat surface protein n=1 Tax=Enterococcus faecalis TaxID=1351 RepID=UPI0025B0E2AF|nr:BspA family leucine-rich repeat surface protein [Enterococcus faecalis]MDN3082723.1 BspA family leucine-rich repeat surface protein [Enterococcus faecalis]
MKSYKCLLISFLVLGNIAPTARTVYAEGINDTKTEEMKDYTKILDESTGKIDLEKTKQSSETITSSESAIKTSSETIATSESSIVVQTEQTEQSVVSEKEVTDSANTVYTSETDWRFQLDSTDNTYKLISYLGTSTNIIVPNEINGKPTKIDLSSAIDLPNITGNRPWETITSVIFSNANGKKVKAYNGFRFSNWNHLTTMDISGLDTSGVTTMTHAFDGCTALKSLDTSGLLTKNVTDMSYMFANSGIESVNLSSCTLFQVQNMKSMFEKSQVKMVKLGNGGSQPWRVTNMESMFAYSPNLTSVDSQNWNVDNLENAYLMFADTTSLVNVNLTGWNTKNLKNMSRMFQSCRATSIPGLSDLNTANVTDMACLLQNSSISGSLDLTKWDTSRVTDMRFMLSGIKLTSLNVSNWNTSNVTDMTYMFAESLNLTFLDLRSWNTSNASNSMNIMFQTKNKQVPLLIVTNDKNLKNYNYTSDNRIVAGPKFVGNGGTFVSSVAPNTSTENYYLESYVLTPKQYADKLNLNTWKAYKDSLKPVKSGSEFQFWNLTDGNEPMQNSDLLNQITYTAEWIDWRFQLDSTDNTYKLISYLGTSTKIIVPNEINGKPTKIDLSQGFGLANFQGNEPYKQVTSVTFSNANGKKVRAYNGFSFSNWDHLTTIDLSGLDTSSVTTMAHAFDGCIALKNIDVSNLNTINVIDMSYMFANSGIETLDFSSNAKENVKNMSYMFSGSKVKTVTFGKANQPWQLKDTNRMFANANELTSVDTQNWNIDNLENAASMFYSTPNLTSVDVTGWNTSKLNSIERMFQACGATSIPGLSDWNTSHIRYMGSFLQGCNLTGPLDLSKWDVSSVEQMWWMFAYASNLTSVDVTGWDTSTVTEMDKMFYGDSNLSSIPGLGNLTTDNARDVSNIFNRSPKLTFLDLTNWNISKAIDNNNADSMFYTENPTPLLIVTNDKNLKNYNYTSDNRIISGPKFVGNGGTFVSSVAPNTSTENYYLESYVLTPKQYADKLNLNTWKAYKDTLKPIKSGSVFQSWDLTSGNEPTQNSDLLNQITYTANWLVNSNIPSNNIDNVISSPVTSYGIAYIPKQFSFNSTPLNDQGNQMIPFERKNSFHVGVRDMRNTDKQWTLEAQLIWDKGKELTGAKIITTNNGTVKKNVNDGTRPFEAVIDLVNCPSEEIEAKPNVVIESGSSQAIMTAKTVVHDAVYDYDLGNVSLEIPETKSVRPGEYIGHVNWQLINGPKGS